MADLNDEVLEQIKQPPHSIEAEQSVLGGLMLDNSAWDTVSEILLEDHFYRGDHRMIFRTMQKLIGAGRPIDVVTLSEELDRKSTRLNSSHVRISYAVFCLKKKTQNNNQ